MMPPPDTTDCWWRGVVPNWLAMHRVVGSIGASVYRFSSQSCEECELHVKQMLLKCNV